MMLLITIALVAGLLPLIPSIILAIQGRDSRVPMTKKLVIGLGSFNAVVALMIVGVGMVWFFAPEFVQASGLAQESGSGDPYASIAAAIAVSVGSISASYAVSTTGSAAVGAIAEKPDIFGRALIFVGLAEGVAIYGLIIAFIIINQ